MTINFIHQLPFWAMFLFMVAVVFLAVNIGFQLARIRLNKTEGAPEGPVGSVVGAVMGLLAFMLAFTFSISAGRFDSRKQLLLDDVNAINTAAMRTQLLPEPHRAECRNLLKQYVDVRVRLSSDKTEIEQGLIDTKSLQGQLWQHAMDLARADMNSDIGALFVESLNEMINLHTERATIAFQYRIPAVIWTVLILLTALGMAGVGFQFGLAGRRSILLSLMLAVSFSLVVTLIADLDKSTSGLMKVNQKPMLELQKQLSQP